MADNIYLDSIEFNSKKTTKRKSSILSELDDLDDGTTVALPSSLYESTRLKKKDKKEKKNEIVDSEIVDDEWINTITSFKAPKTGKKRKNLFDGFDVDKKKKKEKKKSSQNISHKKDFDPELILLKNLQVDQSRFVDSLQKKYDQMESTKSSARGVGKFTTDLINSITSARGVSMQVVDKIISTKKTIADLDFKERKEFGSNSGSEQQNLTNYASTYLKQVMTAGRNNLVAQDYSQPQYYDSGDDSGGLEDLFSSIDESLGETDRSADVEKYLKHENDGMQIKVIYHDDGSDDDIEKKYDYVAYDKNDNVVYDYPLPEKTKLNINRATSTAIDKYGNKYQLIMD
jgi:hypothetical protein